jgi:hypothetical protein
MKYSYILDKEPNGFLCLMIFEGGYFWITAHLPDFWLWPGDFWRRSFPIF